MSDTTSGDTASGDTASGDTASGDTTSGDTASGDTASGDTASGGSTSGRAGVPDALVAEVRAWLEEDPDPETREELAALLDAGDVAALEERFAEPLEFGTAGLRGALGAGPARMNRLVVRRTTAGVARWLVGQGETVASAGIVVGRDARHGSAQFAADVVEVAAALGVRVRVLPQPLPTPLTAFAVLHYGAGGGVMITASHNPAADNGYKVYASDGAQIVPPDDRLIAAAALAGQVPRPGAAPASEGLVIEVERDELLAAYAAAVLAVLRPDGPRELRRGLHPGARGWGWGAAVADAARQVSPRRSRCHSSSTPTPTSRRRPSPTPRSRACSTSRSARGPGRRRRDDRQRSRRRPARRRRAG